jgi:uncharacterized protein YndB with AHSA1/START domain
MTRDIIHAIEIHGDPKTVFDTIATRSGLAAFWVPDVQGDDAEGGELSFGFSGAPVRLPIRVARLDQPREIRWECPGGFPFWEGTKVEWSIEPSEHGAKVTFRHLGFPDTQTEFDFGGINHTWGEIMTRLKEVVESGGKPNPALS